MIERRFDLLFIWNIDAKPNHVTNAAKGIILIFLCVRFIGVSQSQIRVLNSCFIFLHLIKVRY